RALHSHGAAPLLASFPPRRSSDLNLRKASLRSPRGGTADSPNRAASGRTRRYGQLAPGGCPRADLSVLSWSPFSSEPDRKTSATRFSNKRKPVAKRPAYLRSPVNYHDHLPAIPPMRTRRRPFPDGML